MWNFWRYNDIVHQGAWMPWWSPPHKNFQKMKWGKVLRPFLKKWPIRQKTGQKSFLRSLRSIAKKILSVKINAVQFSTLIYLDMSILNSYLGISYLIQGVTSVMEFLLLFNLAKNLHSTYSKKLFYLLNIIFWKYSVWNNEAINFGQN